MAWLPSNVCIRCDPEPKPQPDERLTDQHEAVLWPHAIGLPDARGRLRWTLVDARDGILLAGALPGGV